MNKYFSPEEINEMSEIELESLATDLVREIFKRAIGRIPEQPKANSKEVLLTKAPDRKFRKYLNPNEYVEYLEKKACVGSFSWFGENVTGEFWFLLYDWYNLKVKKEERKQEKQLKEKSVTSPKEEENESIEKPIDS